MYGMADLPKRAPRPNWSGEKYFSKIFLFGTPNEGSASALQSLLKGKSGLGGTTKIPFVRFMTPVDIATMPSVFQLLPHSHTTRFYDEDLQPLSINLFDVANWRKYGWAIYGDKDYLEEFTEAEQGRLEQYFELVLARAKGFHRALNAPVSRRPSVSMFMVGSDCSSTLDAMVVYNDPEKDRWITITKPRSFKNSKGIKYTSGRLKSIMMVPGDGSVTRKSLLAESRINSKGNPGRLGSSLPLTSALFVCENHDRITNNRTIQNNVLISLLSEAKGPAKPKAK